MFSTYRPGDVTILLKDITGLVEPLDTAEREKRIQSGVHYSEMLPVEYSPSEEYLKLFFRAVELYSGITARAVGNVARKILRDKGEGAVLVSLARAGTPIGILIRRWLKEKLGADVPHYTVSIIRGRGIDRNAMNYILSLHPAEKLQFVDGWTGKGAIQRELKAAMADYPGADPGLAVLSDPAGIAGKAGTRDDFLIASSCLNSTVSGLLSRTFYRKDIIGPGEFHGAAFYRELRDRDLTYAFIDAVAGCFSETENADTEETDGASGLEEVERIRRDYGIRDVNLVKPGIGEATRVLLRRLPWKVLVRSLNDGEHLDHLYRLAEEKNVPLEVYPLACYRACGIIRDLADS